jgi:hypothetical protein
MKTVKEWLDTLPKELTKGIKFDKSEIIYNKKSKFPTLSDAILVGFVWDLQKEEWDFWSAFHDCIIIAENLDKNEIKSNNSKN